MNKKKSNNIEKIKELENELSHFRTMNEKINTLSNVSKIINNKSISLINLKREINKLSEDMFYYDMINYLCNIRVNTIYLKECNVLINDLKKAKTKFEIDDDKIYLDLCEKIKKNVIKRGYKLCILKFKEENFSEEIKEFYRLNDLDIQSELKTNYFNIREKNIYSKLIECAHDLLKNYKLLLIGEMKCFKDVFEVDMAEHYKNIKMAKDTFNEFESFIVRIFFKIFEKIQTRILKTIYEENTKQDSADFLNGMLNIMLKVYLNY